MTVSKATQEFVDARIDLLSRALQKVFEGLTVDLDPAEVLGLGLCCDIDGDTLAAAVNTKAGYEQNLARYRGPEYADTDIDWELYLRWYPGEWSRNDTDTPTPASAEIDTIWDQLCAFRETVSAYDRAYFPSLQFEVAALAMGYLNEDGWFSRFPNSVRSIAILDEFGVPADVYRWGTWVNDEKDWPELARYIAQETSDDDEDD